MTRDDLLSLIQDPKTREIASELSEDELRAMYDRGAGPFADEIEAQLAHATVRPSTVRR